MGQQQLILLVLATVIVGVAIVVGIRAFTENSAKSNADAMTQDAVRMASDAQAWFKKPVPFGGPDATTRAAGFAASNFTLADIDRGAAGGTYTNLNGVFSIEAGGIIRGENVDEQNEITVTVDGLTDADITGAIVCLGGSDPAGDPCTVAAPAAGAGG